MPFDLDSAPDQLDHLDRALTAYAASTGASQCRGRSEPVEQAALDAGSAADLELLALDDPIAVRRCLGILVNRVLAGTFSADRASAICALIRLYRETANESAAKVDRQNGVASPRPLPQR